MYYRYADVPEYWKWQKTDNVTAATTLCSEVC